MADRQGAKVRCLDSPSRCWWRPTTTGRGGIVAEVKTLEGGREGGRAVEHRAGVPSR